MNSCLIAEKQYEESQQGEFPRNFEFLGRNFVLHKGVFSPEVFKSSSICVQNLPIKQGDSVLDMGSGTGVVGITLALDNKLSQVVCADINPKAVKNTRENVELHKLQDKVRVLRSSGFSNINIDESFDWYTEFNRNLINGS